MPEKNPRAIRWLHLSDLRLSCPGGVLWWQVHQEFEESVLEHARRLGCPDLIFFTGDLTFNGAKEQFELLDEFLTALLKWLGQVDATAAPLIIPVPGNHDLVRPEKMAVLPFRVLDKYHLGTDDEDVKTLRETLWSATSPDASFFEPLFGNYQSWFRRQLKSQFKRLGGMPHASHFPGDFSLRLELPETFPLTIVGLNSTWIQYRDGDFDRKLELPVEQFHAALPKGPAHDPLELHRDRPGLLLMHHPPSWLSKKASKAFAEEIFRPGRFALCLHGHAHDLEGLSVSRDGGEPRYSFQAPSLFGVEHYGSEKETRIFGYTWGQMSAAGEVRVWPLERKTQGGQPTFVWDQRFRDDGNGTVIRPGAGSPSPPPPAPPPVDLTDWLETLVQQTDHINIAGVGSGAGCVKTAGRYPIEQLYTALRSRGDVAPAGAGEGLRDGDTVKLSELLRRHHLLLIEGQPGSGKTTFLRYVASMLARDELGVPCPGAGTWSSTHLGLTPGDRRQIPVFLRLSRLVAILENDLRTRMDDRERLLELLIEDTVRAEDTAAWRDRWRGLLERGEAVLLLDGLDEVADETLRERVFDIFRNAQKGWPACRIVVTSRPIQTVTVRRMGFDVVAIEPFGDGESKEFVGRWVNALYGLEGEGRAHEDALEGPEVEYRKKLEEAIIDRPSIRRMARNPVMLTCLCVVHWNEGGLCLS